MICRTERPNRQRQTERAAKEREAGRLWSSIVLKDTHVCAAARYAHGIVLCSGGLDPAHGIAKRYKQTRWLPVNGFPLCRYHHDWFHAHPEAWDGFLLRHWGEDLFDELWSLARKGGRLDMDEVLAQLKGSKVEEKP